jgi:hypothetical protein
MDKRSKHLLLIKKLSTYVDHASGTSVDWVKEDLDTPLVYCYELRDRGTYGHLLPPEQILPTSEETMDSLVELIHQGKRFGYFKNTASSIHLSFSLVVLVLPMLRLK